MNASYPIWYLPAQLNPSKPAQTGQTSVDPIRACRRTIPHVHAGRRRAAAIDLVPSVNGGRAAGFATTYRSGRTTTGPRRSRPGNEKAIEDGWLQSSGDDAFTGTC